MRPTGIAGELDLPQVVLPDTLIVFLDMVMIEPDECTPDGQSMWAMNMYYFKVKTL